MIKIIYRLLVVLFFPLVLIGDIIEFILKIIFTPIAFLLYGDIELFINSDSFAYSIYLKLVDISDIKY